MLHKNKYNNKVINLYKINLIKKKYNQVKSKNKLDHKSYYKYFNKVKVKKKIWIKTLLLKMICRLIKIIN